MRNNDGSIFFLLCNIWSYIYDTYHKKHQIILYYSTNTATGKYYQEKKYKNDILYYITEKGIGTSIYIHIIINNNNYYYVN